MSNPSGNENGVKKPSKTFNFAYECCIVLYTLIMDLLVYSTIIPLIGIYFAGGLTIMFQLSPTIELITAVFLTFILVQCACTFLAEGQYWRRLFAQNRAFSFILKIRDAVNCLIFVVSLYNLFSTLENIIGDKSMKKFHLGEGTSYFIFKTIFTWINVDTSLLSSFGLDRPHKGTILDPDFAGENSRFENAAAFLFHWAVMASCVSKMMYYSSLYVYLHSLHVFLSLDPTFEETHESPTSQCTGNACTNNFRPERGNVTAGHRSAEPQNNRTRSHPNVANCN